MTDLRIIDFDYYRNELSICLDRIKLDLHTTTLINDIVHKSLRGVYLKK